MLIIAAEIVIFEKNCREYLCSFININVRIFSNALILLKANSLFSLAVRVRFNRKLNPVYST